MRFKPYFARYFQNQYSFLSKPVIKLPGTGNHLTWAELLHSVFIAGNSGSGKTSGPAAWILNDILQDKARPGGLFLCVKQDERIRIERAIKKAGRGDDLVIISADNPYTVNALEYELFRKGKDHVEYSQVLDLMMEIFLLGENFQAGGGSGGENERFWDKALRKNLQRLMMLLVLANMPVTIANMRKILIDAFSKEDVERYQNLWVSIETKTGTEQQKAIEEYERWCQSNFFLHCFDKADTRQDLNSNQIDDFQLVGDYFFKIWCKISEKTKAIVEESALGLFEPWMSGILKTHFSDKMSDEVRPERCYEEGVLIIVDVPIKEYGISAVYASGIAKKLFQLCFERRIVENEVNSRICVIWTDEYHFLCSPQSDDKFASSSRSTLCAGIYITQSINNIKVSMGKDSAEAKTKSLLSNLGTQIFCGNICRDTNVYAAEMIGKTFINTNSTSFDSNDRASQSSSEQLHYRVQPEHFASDLRYGGPVNNYKVDTIMVVRGKKWSTGEPFREVTFDQRGRRKNFFQFIKSLFV